MQNHYTARQVCLMQRLRQLWEQHVYWTRFFIISTAAGLADLSPVTDRLLQNPKDFARALTPFFGARTKNGSCAKLAQLPEFVAVMAFFLRVDLGNASGDIRNDPPQIVKEKAGFGTFSQHCARRTTGDTLRCLPSHVKEERTLACTQSANSGVDR